MSLLFCTLRRNKNEDVSLNEFGNASFFAAGHTEKRLRRVFRPVLIVLTDVFSASFFCRSINNRIQDLCDQKRTENIQNGVLF